MSVVTAGVVLKIRGAERAYVPPHAACPAEATHALYGNYQRVPMWLPQVGAGWRER